MEEEKKTNKRIVFSIVAVILLIVVVAGATYAYFSATANTDTQTVTTGNMKLTFTNGSIIRAENIIPITDAEIATKATELPFKITNTGDQNLNLEISLSDISIDTELKSTDFKWGLYSATESSGTYTVTSETAVASGDFSTLSGTSMDLLSGVSIPATDPDTAKSYVLRVWIHETGVAQNSMQGKTFSAKVVVNTSDAGDGSLTSLTLAETIIANSSSQLSQDGNVYYFTGSSPDNNLTIKNGIKKQDNASAEDGNSVPTGDPYYNDLKAVIMGINSDKTIAILDTECSQRIINSSTWTTTDTYAISNYTTTSKEIALNETTFLKSGWTSDNSNASYLCSKVSGLDGECQGEWGNSAARGFCEHTLKSDVTFTGSGTSSDPYVIQ